MGVPAFFRWLIRKYPSVIVDCVEELGEDGQEVDSTKPNPNGVEFDNLYLDMNGIIHPCTHPENKPAPKDEDEMMLAIFKCIDRIFKIARPRKLLYLAVDGVAPRAKMNQQRSRRFRAAKEGAEKVNQIALIRSQLEAKGVNLPLEKDKPSHFDSNCITPGTSFMSNLTECLNYYIYDRLASDPGWKNIKVILSDASVPGEGEHKIMDFIRRQRAHGDHDPNTHHCLCGADGDLIMLGLATHELYFTIIREEFVLNEPKRCNLCGQTGHELTECKGVGVVDNIDSSIMGAPTRYIFVRLNVLREYLEEELKMPDLPFEYNFERALDDWVFMCFFVGNDFIPHLPSLEIREGAIDRLVILYKKTLYRTGGFITDSGEVNLDRVQLIMTHLGQTEDQIFRKRRVNENNFRRRLKQKKLIEMRQTMNKSIEDEPEPIDEVKLWQGGYKERYYRLKFNCGGDNPEERYTIGFEYVIGLCWILKYYYQGCASWKWYYPYHYAPFASDFVNIIRCNTCFEKNTSPFSPLEQLMSVFPAASSTLVPPTWADLMTNPMSPILDFYPEDFMIDLNGKRFAWQGVALLPFVDENRLRRGLASVYKDLTNDEVKRNKNGHDRLYIGIEADCFRFINELDPSIYQKKKAPLISDGAYGYVYIVQEEFNQGESIPSPIRGLNTVMRNSTICVAFCDPKYSEDYKFRAIRLQGVIEPPRVLNFKDLGSKRTNTWRNRNNFQQNWSSNKGQNENNSHPIIGMVPQTAQATLGESSFRMISHNLPHSLFIPLGTVWQHDVRPGEFNSGMRLYNENYPRDGSEIRFHPYRTRDVELGSSRFTNNGNFQRNRVRRRRNGMARPHKN
ncbi:5'-3' exoribonuclease 2 homolog [Halyomorpha halys]|uniref:5'-3' exoribonuclease 2 homolog n=1 Tax=Halyomorpha halys TaxID=286706 RepID=UPI0006D4EF6D|nr:5'-3' exoribonuclease 2 homolog [Halyomorpha halys]